MLVTNEIRNYYWHCPKPIFGCRAIMSFLSRACWIVLRRVAPRVRERFQPKVVKKKRRALLAAPATGGHLEPGGFILPGKLKLSTGWLEYETQQDWSTTFSDPEVTDSLHRWNWLLLGLTIEKMPRMAHEQGLALMRSWLSHCLKDERFRLDAYSAGERIVNGSLFLLLTGDGTVPLDIQTALRVMGRQIVTHLEYYEGDLTGNHAFNNARGLLFAGIVADESDAVNLAFEIARERLPRLVTKDGFLREGSSHYHFLFTRWVLEMLWIANRNGLLEMSAILKEYGRKLVERCWFFLVKNRDRGLWRIPLIGDVSPDSTPDWLLNLPWSRLATGLFSPVVLPESPEEHGWADLFGIDAGVGNHVVSESASYPDSFWHRIEHGNLTLFLFAAADDGQLRASHRHFDLCGFVLFQAGKPILIDCGRLDYTQSEISMYGRGAYAHNTIFVNGMPPTVDAPSWLQKRYKVVEVETELHKSDDSTVFVIRHNGFDRLSNMSVNHERMFTLGLSSFKVEDRLSGKGPCQIMLRFHLAPNLSMSKEDELAWKLNPIEAKVQFDNRLQQNILVGQTTTCLGGLYSPEYGVLEECHTIELEGHIVLPTSIKNSFCFSK